MKKCVLLILLCSGIYSFASDTEDNNEGPANVFVVVSDPRDMLLLQALQQGGVPGGILVRLSQRLNQGAENARRVRAAFVTMALAQNFMDAQFDKLREKKRN